MLLKLSRQAHSVRGFISTAGKKHSVKIESAKNEEWRSSALSDHRSHAVGIGFLEDHGYSTPALAIFSKREAAIVS
jgi:hypothetical protein